MVNLLVTLEADSEEVFCIDKLFADSSGLVVDLGGRPFPANLALGVFGQVLNAQLPIKRTHPPALG